MIKRRRTRVVNVGKVKMGYPHPISVQSMTNVSTEDVGATIKQIKKLEKVGCEIIRVAVLNEKEAFAIKEIKRDISIPLVADIHFDYCLALLSIKSGCDAVRINPGNIHRKEDMLKVVREAKNAGIPIRIGMNSGSVRKPAGSKKPIEDLMVESAFEAIKILEKEKFYDIIISLKSSDIQQTINAYKKISKLCDYPTHLGITAAGLPEEAVVKSSIGMGFLLLNGIGDTIRVSITGNPELEVEAGRRILASLGLRRFGPEVISCPTCGRCKVDLPSIVKKVEKELISLSKIFPEINCLKVAVMGCEVNGPGEAKEADVGVACSRGGALLFAKGEKIKKINLTEIEKELIGYIKNEMVE
ncbi:MAG: flavodoxin-dependent (E)-4-hydroxy-3-methylbut-2-enyl-diphosphate synthase [Candidatus Omnitrophota bacterium]